MIERTEAWFARLSPEDKRKFTDRLWAAVLEDKDESGTEPGAEGTIEGPGPDEADRSE